ncbi:hypothetical protein Tco_0581562 [Tanacetum coccineum]
MTKSSSTSLNLFLEETNTFDNSLTESKTFRYNLEEISSSSTTTRSDYSLPDYEVFYLNDDHIEGKSSGSTTTHADFSQYDSIIYLTRELRVHVPNVLPIHPTLDLDLDFILLSEPLFAYIVWIFLPFLTYPVAPPYLLSYGNDDTSFDPGIST